MVATTKIWPIKDSLKRVVDYAINPEKTETEDDLYAVMHYATKPEKVTRLEEKRCFVTGVACNANTAYSEMMQVKESFGKASKNVAYHAYQSFKPGEVTPEKCHQIGVDLARKLWGDRYQVVVATHLDKEHCHNHFVINSVSYIDGRCFDGSKRRWYEMANLSDKLCKENGLSVIKNPKGHTPRNIYFAEKRGEPTKYNLMRRAIDKAVSVSYDGRSFKSALLKMGYVIEAKETRKHPTIRSINSKKATRLYRLGEEYELDIIEKRTAMNPSSVRYDWCNFMYGKRNHSSQDKAWQETEKILNRCTGLEAVIVLFCFLIGILPKNFPKEQRRKPLSPELREAIRRLDRYANQLYLTEMYHFQTLDEVETFRIDVQSEIDTLCKERRKLYDKVTRAETEDEKNIIRSSYKGYTDKISALRKDLKTADTIIQDEPYWYKCIEAERNMQNPERAYREQIKGRRNNDYER